MRARRALSLAAAVLALSAPVMAGEADALLRRGDETFAGRTVSTGAAEALALYERAAAVAPDDARPRWKASRALLWLGDHAEKKERRALYERGIAFGEEAVKLDPDSPDARFWLSAVYGTYGELRGVMKSLALLKPIRANLEAINRIDERHAGGAGHRVLGVVDYKVPAIAGGSRRRAREKLGKALEIAPDNPFNLYYMGECLVDSGRREEARAYLEKVLVSRTSADVDGPDLAMIQAKAGALLKKISR